MINRPDAQAASAIRVENVSKRYAIGAAPGSGRLYDRISRPLRRDAQDHPTIWALQDISFDVPPGTVAGLIGRNGSGKSTLLKILARITAPTGGSATIRGRVGALLQVGAGFHPELSGRDNIALSGAILGMDRQEVAARMDDIIAFADIGQFLDTPVKHYSSGMYLRLAFSVSAHLSCEIMLVDEVLAVGDAEFQAKCKKRIRELVKDGRTVVFVSHQMPSVVELCDSAVVLDRGHIEFMGDAAGAVRAYESLQTG
jgi:lipopolysaccharide transport system ATP-binding protein